MTVHFTKRSWWYAGSNLKTVRPIACWTWERLRRGGAARGNLPNPPSTEDPEAVTCEACLKGMAQLVVQALRRSRGKRGRFES